MWPPAVEGHGPVSVCGSVWLLVSALLFLENVSVVLFSSRESWVKCAKHLCGAFRNGPLRGRDGFNYCSFDRGKRLGIWVAQTRLGESGEMWW